MAGLELGANNNSTVSRPFVVSAVVLAFAGSLVGSVWTMSLFGMQAESGTYYHQVFPLHRALQIDGFLTVLIMGIGYMIVPRFRNSTLPSTKLAYVSLALALASIALSTASMASPEKGGMQQLLSSAARLAGIAVFAGMMFWMLRIRPRLLGLADYFIGLSVAMLVALGVIRLLGIGPASALSEVEVLLLFPLLMIFGVEYKTMPSFLGFIRPRKSAATASLALAIVSVTLGVSSALLDSILLSIAFNVTLLGCATAFAHSLYLFGGFDNSQILKLISGEKKARYLYTMAYSRLSFLFLYAGIAFAMLFSALSSSSDLSYLSYDLAIHLTAIGFIGTTIALYLPLMLPAITGKQVYFARFNHAPVLLLVAALAVRAAGDVVLTYGLLQPPLSYLLMASGWMVVLALAAFVVMVHRSMKGTTNTGTNIM
ncbi:Cytochrome C and Quinol oxidase polypeptide I [Candidatus Nitrososphaera evergladensis SR1]|uniref:Cytochrome C and Quinol oxidase polypeptide I n=1 Tax=Candidatus Nitrososphaera evergladensis SR1 TaxID=1459636 RepID=A0A075MXY7_9ARCH|nr:hypothetical protein [Candidatus Nitrososphaera evergladensis]AIF84149.1 Cytochrome C and Quinol oxidase polypeptide I [Candidatus Nitrososphaera evergladensis SR1]